TDVIIGFPGETEEDFEATCEVLRTVGFSRIHIFSYSPRSGTTAAAMPRTVPPAVVAHRRRQLRALERQLAETYYASLLGRTLDVLVEGPDPEHPGQVRGTSCRYAPVAFPAHAPALVGKRVRVRAVQVERGLIIGEPESTFEGAKHEKKG